jgi:hypothetical protein
VKCDPSSPNSPLLPSSGHLSVLPIRSPSPYQALLPTRRTLQKTPRLSFFALQHFQVRSPFFSSNRLAGRPKNLATSLGSSTLRVWLPSRCLQPSQPLEASFSSQRSWASPSRAFLLPDDRSWVSPEPSAPALPCETSSASHRRSSGFLPSEKPSPYLPPQTSNPRRGLVLSWAFRPLRLSLRTTPLKASPF